MDMVYLFVFITHYIYNSYLTDSHFTALECSEGRSFWFEESNPYRSDQIVSRTLRTLEIHAEATVHPSVVEAFRQRFQRLWLARQPRDMQRRVFRRPDQGQDVLQVGAVRRRDEAVLSRLYRPFRLNGRTSTSGFYARTGVRRSRAPSLNTAPTERPDPGRIRLRPPPGTDSTSPASPLKRPRL